ncbi:hypothetical protein [Streptomyces sp. YGL11-2]|uniref:hypothetical protein n=1 Tax=Streptomyces sp. YGL11-2 TaxID=3414028 RepID=UPI003CE7D261
MSNVKLVPEEEERLQRLRAMLRGTEAASENKYLRGLQQGSKGGVLIGAMLHAADRYRQGLALTDLEQPLLRVMQGILTDQEIRASGQEYRSAVEDLGSLDVIAAEVTARPPSSGFSAADFRALLPGIGQEALGMANVSVASPEALAAGQRMDSPSFQDGLHEFGFAATVFRMPPSTEPSEEVPSFQASLQFEKFFVRRAVGDQGGGKDEIYWTVAATSDKYAAPVYTSEEFGAVKVWQTRFFDSGNKVVFNGPVGRYLVLGITAWEADQSHSEWYDALYRTLSEWLEEAKYELEFAFLAIPDWAGLAFEFAKLMVWLMEYLRNHDDNSCTRTIILDRHALVTLHERLTDVWEFDGDGHHALHVKYTGQRPPAPSGALEYVRLDAGKLAWNASVSLGWESMTPPALVSYGNALHAVYVRPDDRALMWSTMAGGAWTKPAQINGFTSNYQAALAMYMPRTGRSYLFLAFVAQDGKICVSVWDNMGAWSNGVMIPYAHTARGVGAAVTSELWVTPELHVVHRSGSGTLMLDYSTDGTDWGDDGSSPQPFATTTGVSMAAVGRTKWYCVRGTDGRNHVYFRGVNSQGEAVLPRAWDTLDALSLVKHNDEMCVVARNSEGKLQALHGTESAWTPFPAADVGAMEGEVGAASHNGSLYVMYRRPS